MFNSYYIMKSNGILKNGLIFIKMIENNSKRTHVA